MDYIPVIFRFSDVFATWFMFTGIMAINFDNKYIQNVDGTKACLFRNKQCSYQCETMPRENYLLLFFSCKQKAIYFFPTNIGEKKPKITLGQIMGLEFHLPKFIFASHKSLAWSQVMFTVSSNITEAQSLNRKEKELIKTNCP